MTAQDKQLEQPFLRACAGEVVLPVPVWFMRQAGRYLPEYQALRAQHSFLDVCRKPELAAKATLDAARILQTDAAIIFSDITLPAIAMGLELDFDPGPVFANPIRKRADVSALQPIDAKNKLPFVMDAIRQTREQLPKSVSLIGFIGAPFTVAAYMIEGNPAKSRNWIETKRLMYSEPQLFSELLERITDALIEHGQAQLDAGCDAIQLFDSNAGILAPSHLHDLAFASAQRTITTLQERQKPVIYFARNISGDLGAAAQLGADVLGIDWTVDWRRVFGELDELSRSHHGNGPRALMGNLDPTMLFGAPEQIDAGARYVLSEAFGKRGFIFNLGHGLLPGTPHEEVKRLVQTVHAWRP